MRLIVATLKGQFNYSLPLFKGWFTYGQSVQYKMLLVSLHVYRFINPLPHMAILDSTNSAVTRDMVSKILINRDTIT